MPVNLLGPKQAATIVMAAVIMVAGSVWAESPPKMKMITGIPPGIATLDNLETRLGTLMFFDGVPNKDTVPKMYDHLDFQHAFQAFMSGIQNASMDAMKKGILAFGPANTTNVYMMLWLQLEDEPMVIETPPDVLGIIDDHWFKYVSDFGRLGPDKGKGRALSVFPPGYDGAVPDGYHVARTNTYGNWVIWRGFQVDGSPQPAVGTTKKSSVGFKLSPARSGV